MDQQKIKEYLLKMEGISEGIKFGATQAIQWFLQELAKEEAEKNKKTEG